MNNSVLTGQYPSELKHAKVIPIFKGGDETDPSYYRPISLLLLFNRLMLFLFLSLLMSYPQYALFWNSMFSYARPILPLRISVIFLLIHPTFIHITLDLYINKSSLKIQLNSFSIFGAKLWNCLKPHLRKLRKQPFKIKFINFYLRYLVMRMNYVDVSTLMLKITKRSC